MGFDVPPDAIFAWQKTLDLSQLLTGQACELVNQLPNSRLGV